MQNQPLPDQRARVGPRPLLPALRAGLALLAALAVVGGVVPAPAAPAASAAPAEPAAGAGACPDALTTAAVADCLARQLAESDRRLVAALEEVRRSALAVPGADFQLRWRRFVARHGGGEDPARQLRRFQAERRRLCFYAWSLSLEGTGFGSFVTGCELSLSRTLLQELSPR